MIINLSIILGGGLRFNEKISYGFKKLAEKYKDNERKYNHYVNRSMNNMGLEEGCFVFDDTDENDLLKLTLKLNMINIMSK